MNFKHSLLLQLLACVVLPTLDLKAQPSDAWDRMPLERFLQESEEARRDNSLSWQFARAEIFARASELMVTTQNVGEVARLLPVAGTLSGEVKLHLREMSVPNDATFEDIRALHTIWSAGEQSPEKLKTLVSLWCRQDYERMSLAEMAWALPRLTPAKLLDRRVTATWTGHLVVPKSGDYRLFFASHPGNAGGKLPTPVRVLVDGVAAIDTTLADLNSSIQVLSLDSGSHSFRMVIDGTLPGMEVLGDGLPLFLSWEADGVLRSPIPATCFRKANNDVGVRAEYVLSDGTVVVQDEPTPGLQFVGGGAVVCKPVGDTVKKLADRLVGGCTQGPPTNEAIDFLVSACPALSVHHLQQVSSWLESHATSAHDLSLRASLGGAFSLLRLLDSATAVDFAGAQLLLSEDEFVPKIGRDPRPSYDILKQFSTQLAESPDSVAARFHAGFLRRVDGGCHPVTAFLMSYSYARRTEFSTWIEFLESEIDRMREDETDCSAWLIARGHAAQLVDLPPDRLMRDVEAMREAVPWLEQAYDVAKKGAQRERIVREILFRHFALADFESADETLRRCASQTLSGRQVAAYRTEITRAQQRIMEQRKKQEKLATEAYRYEMQRRLRKSTNNTSTTP